MGNEAVQATPLHRASLPRQAVQSLGRRFLSTFRPLSCHNAGDVLFPGIDPSHEKTPPAGTHVCRGLRSDSVAAQSKPKRLLLVTISNGFRHSSIETTEKVIRELAAKSGDFVVISTSDHPDYPDYSASAGGPRAGDAAWGSPFGPQLLDGTPAQQMFIRRLNDWANSPLSPLEFAVRKARAELTTASLTEPPGSAALAARADAVAKAELAMALAKATQFQTLQASENRVTPQQVQVLAGKDSFSPCDRFQFCATGWFGYAQAAEGDRLRERLARHPQAGCYRDHRSN